MIEKNLGDILIDQGIIDRDALNRALQLQNRRLGEILIEEKLADPVAIANALKFQARATAGKTHKRLAVDMAALDEILDRLEALEDQLRGLSQNATTSPTLNSLRQTIETILLEPVDGLFKKALWVATKAATELGKQVELVFEGEGLVIDRALAHELADVLLHLVRNAIDHGIEAPQERIEKGKRPVGTLQIRMQAASGKLLLTVSDDGRGIDFDKVYERAKAQGFLKAERAAVSEAELCQVLFTPGFSTSAAVSAISGRGVGLDVVEATALRLGGEITVRSVGKAGATFSFTAPLRYTRMSIIPLRCGDEWIATTALDVAKVEDGANASGLLSPLSLFAKRDAVASISASPMVVQLSGGSRWAFDEVGQPEFVMVREASAFAQGAHGVVGGARLANGCGVLLLDLNLLSSVANPIS